MAHRGLRPMKAAAPPALRLPPLALGVVLLAGLGFGFWLAERGLTEAPHGLLELFVGWSFIGVGVYAWWRRPSNPIGPLMTATGYLWFVSELSYIGDPGPLLFSLAGAIGGIYHATAIHLLLVFPSGRLTTRAARVTAVAGYVVLAGGNLLVYLVADWRTEFACGVCPGNSLQVLHDHTLAQGVITTANLIATGIVAWVLVRLIETWRGSHGWRRRAFTPLLFSGAATAFILCLSFLTLAFDATVAEDVFTAATAAFATVPYTYLWGLARSTMLAGGAVGHLTGQLAEAADCGEAEEALRRALGDPSLELGFSTVDEARYVGSRGQEVKLPGPDDDRAVALVELDGGHPVAAFTYDAALVDDPPLVEAAATAAGLAIQKHQLEAELRAKVEELRASRERLVEAGYDERRRLERNLHDGAQQRLVSLALDLRLARAQLAEDPEAAREQLDAVGGELELALGELRELARGIHPAILSDRGLDAALGSLASRSPFEVEVESVPDGRLPEKVESAAYFVVSEAMANAIKHSRATHASISVTRENGRVTVKVSDDGVGGANPDKGSGLRGLLDRVTALDGGLEVYSQPDNGTTIRARIPCE